MDPTEPGAGSALLEVSEAVKQSGQYDVWSAQSKTGSDDEVKVKVCVLRLLLHFSQAKKNIHVPRASPVLVLMQAPDVPNPRAAIALPAVPAPHAGTSYNPPEAAYTSLLRAAHEAELRRVQEAEALEAIKARILSARHSGGDGDGGALGMLIDKPGEGEEDAAPTEHNEDRLEQYDSGSLEKKKSVLQRKTKQQRRKAEQLRADVCDSTYFLSPSPHVATTIRNNLS